MTDNNRKRPGSFRKFFPNLFFKSKDKSKETNFKVNENLAKGNQYHDPRVIRSDKREDNETIYENLTTNRHIDNESQSTDIQSSHHSSSSTLVSESVKTRSQGSEVASDREYTSYSARPQVPPKPNDIQPSKYKYDMPQYPDVYYHSVEKLTDKISPLDEIEIYRASHSQANPASVGAEIKRVSTKFLISPKKEAEVRTIQPTRARSLSFDKENAARSQNNRNIPQTIPKKVYNYSAPTSPMPISHRIPSMPKTVSPYEHVRKTMMEAEEKRNNSLSRTTLRIQSTPSPRGDYGLRSNPASPSATMSDHSTSDKEKTRQKVEAFYWQKLKEMKDKEDEYFLRQSLHSSLQNPARKNVYPNNSIPPATAIEPRSFSLPRGVELQSYASQPVYSPPFVRTAPERRTDTYINSHARTEHEIIYRHPEKLNSLTPQLIQPQTPIFQRGSLTRETSTAIYPKRVSFDGYSTSHVKNVDPTVTYGIYKSVNRNECPPKVLKHLGPKGPPVPPVRTTSVGAKSFKALNSRRIINLAGNSLCSESESGSEAGEIQRILQHNAQKGEQYLLFINVSVRVFLFITTLLYFVWDCFRRRYLL